MKQKQPRIVVTFHTTAEAMATEQLCREQGLAGKTHLRTSHADSGLRHRVERSARNKGRPASGAGGGRY